MPDRSRPRLLILGCSTRAAAWSAVRAGLFPVCADEFGDADLRQVAEVVPIRLDGDQFGFAARPTVIAAARMAVGGYHTLPFEVSDTLRQFCGPYLGVPGAAVMLTSGWLLSVLMSQKTLPFLETRCGSTDEVLQELVKKWSVPPADGSWLQKPVASGGGRGIRHWTADAAQHPMREMTCFQRYQRGESWSAVFLASCGEAELIGISRQLIGDTTSAAPWKFGYCGSIGPTTLPASAKSVLSRMAMELVRITRLRGLFGIDFIWDGTTPWVVEVNPRYTASCEILELALRRPLLTEHWRACLPDGDPPPEPLPVAPRCGAAPPVLGKMIVYARQPVTAPDFSRFLRDRSPWSAPFLADVPHIGTRFDPGQPVCTVFASGGDYDECYRKLVRRVRRIRRWLGESVPVTSE